MMMNDKRISYVKSATMAAQSAPAWRPSLGNYSLAVTAALPTTQPLFDLGVNLAFNFNQAEARRWFNLTLDAEAETCPMCWWGLALSHAPYLNHPIKPLDDVAAGRIAADRAKELAASAPALGAKERGLIEAMAVRFPETPSGNQSAAAERYVRALAGLHAAAPSDLDVTTFYAEALMLTMCVPGGYDFYLPDGAPRDRTRQAETLLLSAAAEGDGSRGGHPYAQHLYIHLTEPDRPSNASSGEGATRGLPSALALMATFRGTQAQHLLHSERWQIGTRAHSFVHAWDRTGTAPSLPRGARLTLVSCSARAHVPSGRPIRGRVHAERGRGRRRR
jgi:hypothetical protein